MAMTANMNQAKKRTALRHPQSLILALALSLLAAAGCTPKSQTPGTSEAAALRPLTPDERVADLDALILTMKADYGPMKYKQDRFGFKIDDLAQQYRKMAQDAKSDEESLGVIAQFLARFHDGHISMQTTVERNTGYTVPIILTPVEDKTLIAKISDPVLTSSLGIEVGDEVLEIDGRAPFSYLPTINKYRTFATPESDRHFILYALMRPIYMTDLKPTSPTVALKIAKPDGRIIERTLIWSFDKNPAYPDRTFPDNSQTSNSPSKPIADQAGLADARRTLTDAYSETAASVINLTSASIDQMGAETPFFATPQVQDRFKLVQVHPSESTLKKYGLADASKAPALYAALYRFNEKLILLIRIATYEAADAADRLAWYKATLSDYGQLADVLVIDQTHNPGGSLTYAQSFVSIFAKTDTRGPVNFLHADRKWLSALGDGLKSPEKGEERLVDELGYKLVEEAYDKGLDLTERPISLTGYDYMQPANFTFKKPVLMLIDELSGSCGDVVPMLMKANGLAKLFGQRAMGLGGNVEIGLVLPASQTTVRFTRGFFYTFSPSGVYDMTQPTENNGIAPDISYRHTVADTRMGFVAYVTSFSKSAVDLLMAPQPQQLPQPQ